SGSTVPLFSISASDGARFLWVLLKGTPTAGMTYPLAGVDFTGEPPLADITYQDSPGAGPGSSHSWHPQPGTLPVTAFRDTHISFTVRGAPFAQDSGTGTFTLDADGTVDPIGGCLGPAPSAPGRP